MRLVVGLGNPGPRYAMTRHNLGFMVVDYIARRAGVALARRESEALVGWAAPHLLLAQPQTYMNASGDAVLSLVRRHNVRLEELLVVCDDMDLPPGRLRLRPRGSAGTHNGLRSIVARLGTEAFPRLRIGIGPPPPSLDAAAFVLAPMDREAWATLSESVARAADAVEVWVRAGIESAMNQFNRPRTGS
ncbi:MAG TPA: aminoacyl-tRNA hydrolase [Limnochordia bacterium]